MGNSESIFIENNRDFLLMLSKPLIENKIDLKILLLSKESKYIEILKTINDECSFEIEDNKDIFNIILKNSKDIVAFVSIKFTSDVCSIIGYRCVNSKYTNCGIGEFLGFIAINVSNYYNKKYIFSIGVSDVVTFMSYLRISDTKEIAVSQKILIDKFGFIDSWKGVWDNKKKIFSSKFMSVCKDTPETFLDLKFGNMILYEKYKEQYKNETEKIFIKYNNKLKSTN